MRTLFERAFLHEVHIASRSSSLSFEALSSAGVEPVDWDGEDWGCQVKATGMRVFNLRGCRHQEKVGVYRVESPALTRLDVADCHHDKLFVL